MLPGTPSFLTKVHPLCPSAGPRRLGPSSLFSGEDTEPPIRLLFTEGSAELLPH